MVNDRIKAEIERKAVHLLGGLSVSMFGYFIPEEFHAIFICGFACFVAFLCVLEMLRLRGVLTLPMLRDYESSEVGGYLFFFIGAFICFLIFPKEIAVASVLMLSTGDAASGIMFTVMHHDAHRRVKPIAVIFVMLLTSFTSCYMFFLMIKHDSPLIIALSGAIGATIADAFPTRIFHVDDNLTIPIFGGCMMLIAALLY